MTLTGLLGVPPRQLAAELRREVRELRDRGRLIRAAARGDTIASRLTIDNGTLVIDGQAKHAIISRCIILHAPGPAFSVPMPDDCQDVRIAHA